MTTNPYWNVYVPGPTTGTDWYQGYIRIGASDDTIENTKTLTLGSASDFSSGVLIYSTGKVKTVGYTSSVSTYGGESFSAVTNGNMLYSATYTYDQGNNYQRQVSVWQGGKFSANIGDEERIFLGNRMDVNLGNISSIISPLKFEDIFGTSVKYAPIEVGIANNKIELKGGFLTGVIEQSPSLRGFLGVTIAVNPVTDGLIGGTVMAYSAAFTAVNTTMVALTVAFSGAIAIQGIWAWGDGSEEAIKSQMKVLRTEFAVAMGLFVVTEAAALVMAAIALTKRAVDWAGDYPAFPTIKLTPAGIKMQAGATTWMDLTAFGIVMNGPMIQTLVPLSTAIPMLAPPVPVPI
jgi:hypothetical protein